VDVALLARGEAALRETADELAADTGRRVVPVVADTTNADAVQAAAARAAQALGGPIHLLVNAAAEPAGGNAPPTLAEITAGHFHGEMDTKVMGYIRTAQALVPGMKAEGFGRIVNISGMAARTTGNAVGSIRNVALVALTKNLAEELGPHGIHVHVVHPGMTNTERMPALIERRAAARGVAPDVIEAELANANTIRHLVDAAEVADVVAFLCSPRSRALNGDVIAANGGSRGAIHY
jgi:NAD(P)-dependent dehydrogenase (short-subunit alcohol dehydrogenase family)